MSARPRAARLPRVLGALDVVVLASASMGPAYGLASTMGPMVAAAGALAPLALAITGAVMLPIALAFARLARARPDAGSSYAWSAQAFGPRTGAYAAWLLLLSNVFATMTTALPAATYTLALVAPGLAASPLADAAVGALWIAASAALLARGLRPTAAVTAIFLAGELLVVLAVAVAAALHPAAAQPAAGVARAIPPGAALSGARLAGVLGAVVLGIWMTDGWEVSASASEETTGDRGVPGRGGVIGLVATTAVLAMVMAAYLRAGTVAGFTAHQTDAMRYVAERVGGGLWTPAVVATVLVSSTATLWTTVLYLSRSLYAMGRAGLVHERLGALDARGVPMPALVAVAVATGGTTLATGVFPSAAAVLDLALEGTSVFLGALFCLSAAAAARFARTPREAALPLAGGAVLAAVVAFGVAEADATARAVECAGLALGLPFAAWRGRPAARTARA